MNVLVFGTGAIGGLYGIMLAKAGCYVSVVCRSDVDVVRQQGLTLESPWGNTSFMPSQVCESTAAVEGDIDLIIVATKALPGQAISDKIRSRVSQNTAILLLQNGMFIEDEYNAAFPNTTIIRGLAFVCVSKTAPGHIYHQDYGRLVIGKYPSGNSEIVTRLAKVFNASGVPCKVDESIQKSSWRKLLWNAPFNPLSVIGGGVNTQQMLASPESRRVVENVMKEVCTLAQADGFKLGQRDRDKNIENTLAMHPYKTSMLLDYESGRQLEIESILGNAIRFAAQHSIAVPHMDTLYASLKLIELKSEATQ